LIEAIHYVDADKVLQDRISREWGEAAARHMHVSDGFSLVALAGDEPVGLIAIEWRDLPPLPATIEAYIDIIEVRSDYRRRGIAANLVRMVAGRARERGAYQMRAWSTEDKIEAIPMWRALGFGLCPATIYPRGQIVQGFFVTLVL
jgi:GNAT superfamily N-acetyltransferase